MCTEAKEVFFSRTSLRAKRRALILNSGQLSSCAEFILRFTFGGMGEQLNFAWQVLPKRRVPDVETPTTFRPGVDGPVIRPASAPHAVKRYLRDVVEKFFRDRQIPYVSVDEAKKALFSGAKLGTFHFVSYNKTGPNWLVWAEAMRKGVREDMENWEDVFGEGFMAVIAKEQPIGELTFTKLSGEETSVS